MSDLPPSMRVQYSLFFTSKDADASYVLETGRIAGTIPGALLKAYVEELAGNVIHELNEATGVSDFRLMTYQEVECFVRGMHKHNLTLTPEEQDEDTHIRH